MFPKRFGLKYRQTLDDLEHPCRLIDCADAFFYLREIVRLDEVHVGAAGQGRKLEVLDRILVLEPVLDDLNLFHPVPLS